MPVFCLSVTEYQLVHAFKNQYIDSSIKFTLHPDDTNYLCYFINKQYAGLFKISLPSLNEKQLFSYPLEAIHITEKSERVLFSFPTPVTNETSIPFNKKDEILFLEKIKNSYNSLRYYYSNIEDLFDTEHKILEKQKKKKTPSSFLSKSQPTDYKNITEPHLRAQFLIKEMGNFLNYDTFIAKNDHHRFYNNKPLTENTLLHFPKHNLSDDLTKHLSLIDAMWFENGSPVALFEVEMTTSIYSGILRMADLICAIDFPNTNLYIVTDRKRENKVRKELERPVFKKIGLHSVCKIIFLDDLETLHNIVSFIPGYVKTNILDKISC